MSEIDQADRSKRHWVLVEKVSIDKGKEGLRFIEIPPESQTLENGKERIFSAKAFKLAYQENSSMLEAPGFRLSGYTQICYSYTSGGTPKCGPISTLMID